jgi:hypothetical protein
MLFARFGNCFEVSKLLEEEYDDASQGRGC